MTLDADKIANRLGATYVAQLPDTGDGAFGMAHLAQFMKARLDARDPRTESAVGWIIGSKVQMSAETERRLIALAEKLSTPDRRVDPMQLAAALLEQSVQRLTQEDAT